MPVIDKGFQTKQNILNLSKKLFYERGYNSVKVKDIVSACNISAGNLTYYFPTKISISVCILNEYINNIFSFLDEMFPEWEHFYYKNLGMSLIFNINIFNDPRLFIYYKELMETNTMHYLLRESIVDVYHQLAESFGHNYNSDEFKYFYFGDLGARHEITLNFLEGNFPELDPITMVKVVHKNTTLLLEVSDVDFQRMFNEVFNSLMNVDFSHINLL